MQLDGTLDKFPLRELIEMVVYSSVTGALELRAGADVGQIFFRDGQPYHAAVGDLAGVDALVVMFEQRDAPFRFVADHESAESTLWMDPWELIERSEEQAHKWAGIRARIPSTDCVPSLGGAPFTGQIQISEAIWPVLAAVDGQRTVQEISEHLNWVLFDTCAALLPLIDRGLIAIQPARPGSRAPRIVPSAAQPADAALPTPAQAGASEQGAAQGFLERLLAEAQAKEQQRPDLTDDETHERKRVYRYVDDRR